jgi:CHAD domain-containing protein
VKARAVENLDPSAPLRPNVSLIVRTRLEEVRSFADDALAPDASRSQHDMRIAAKRLRYVLEIFEPCLGEEAKLARRAAKRLQSTLGDLHDCDLMLTRVEHVGSAAELLRERRKRLFHDFVELWQAEASNGTWAALERTLSATR